MGTFLIIRARLFTDLIWPGIDDASYDAEHHPTGVLWSQKHYYKDAFIGFARRVLAKGFDHHSYGQSTSAGFS